MYKGLILKLAPTGMGGEFYPESVTQFLGTTGCTAAVQTFIASTVTDRNVATGTTRRRVSHHAR